MIARLLEQATPGPWGWFGHRRGEMYLATPKGGRRFVMAFKRKGMRGAEPMFQVYRDRGGEPWEWDGLMTPATDLAVQEVEYRDDIKDIDHPDARLIALAPDMARLLVDWDPLIEWLAHGMCLEPDEDGQATCEGECVTCKARESRSRFAELEQRADTRREIA